MSKNVKAVSSCAREIIEVKSKVCVLEAYNAGRRHSSIQLEYIKHRGYSYGHYHSAGSAIHTTAVPYVYSYTKLPLIVRLYRTTNCWVYD